MDICVVGGGTSGTEAAREAEARGARVTVVEASDQVDPPWTGWPRLLGGRGDQSKPVAAPGLKGDWTLLTAEARSVRRGRVTTTGGEVAADGVVMATGCGFEAASFPGIRKRGVHVLDGTPKYRALGRAKDGIDRAVVCGEGIRAFQVADRLLGKGRRIRLTATSWPGGEPSAPVLAALKRAAALRGVSFLEGPPSRAVGDPSLEAVVAGGDVIPCDALVIVSRRVPRTVPTEASMGSRGGFLVDGSLKTDADRTYAAGGCAEVRADRSSYVLADEGAMTGRIAGANCTGEKLQLAAVKCEEACAFGVVWSRLTLRGMTDASAPWFESTAYSQGETAACTITYDRAGGRAVRVEWVDDRRTRSPGFISALPGLNLRMLAYGYGGSSDISLVSQTARQGLEEWQKS